MTDQITHRRDWRDRLPGILVFGGLAAMGLFSAVGLYQQARVLDAPIERWVADHYDADDSVAFIYADSAAALPLPYRWGFPPPVWEIDHDAVVITRPASKNNRPACLTVVRENLTLVTGHTEPPCVDPRTGEELDRDDRVTYAQVLSSANAD